MAVSEIVFLTSLETKRTQSQNRALRSKETEFIFEKLLLLFPSIENRKTKSNLNNQEPGSEDKQDSQDETTRQETHGPNPRSTLCTQKDTY